MEENKRIEYIDVAKFLAMLLVVFTHGFKECTYLAFAYSFHLPVFFFLNGMTLKLNAQPFEKFLVKKLKGYIVPMLGLGFVSVLLDMLIKIILHHTIADNALLSGIVLVLNQVRTFALWFLPALFFVDLILFGLNKAVKGNVVLLGVASLAVLGIGILFNMKHNVPMVWNFDASLFGVVFTYFGYMFRYEKLSAFYNLLTGRRWLSLLIGIALLIGTYCWGNYCYETTGSHLEMFARKYSPYYIILPCALIGCFGFILFCRGISNFVLAKPVEINLALLPLHQVFAFPFFKYIVVKNWWMSVAALPQNDYRFVLFTFAMMLFSVAFAAMIHFILKYSPVSLIVNQPLPRFYSKIFKRRTGKSGETCQLDS